MEIYQIDDQGRLFISPSIDDWKPVAELGIHIVIDLDDDLDIGVPEVPNQILYVYFPFDDRPELPDEEKLHSIARMGARLIGNGYKLLAHCGMGHNRSALVAGLILRYLGMEGDAVVRMIQGRRHGALYNKAYADYVACVPIRSLESDMGAGI